MEILITLLIIVIVLSIILPPKRRYGSRWKKTKPEEQTKPTPLTYEKDDQLSITLRNKYTKKRLLNKTEEEVYKILLRLIYIHAKGQYKINMQTSLGEILGSTPDGYRTINAKRVDFCIVDKEFMPVAVIEVNGKGHYQGDALVREETKRTAIECAGIKYISVRENEDVNIKISKEIQNILSEKDREFLTPTRLTD